MPHWRRKTGASFSNTSCSRRGAKALQSLAVNISAEVALATVLGFARPTQKPVPRCRRLSTSLPRFRRHSCAGVCTAASSHALALPLRDLQAIRRSQFPSNSPLQSDARVCANVAEHEHHVFVSEVCVTTFHIHSSKN